MEKSETTVLAEMLETLSNPYYAAHPEAWNYGYDFGLEEDWSKAKAFQAENFPSGAAEISFWYGFANGRRDFKA